MVTGKMYRVAVMCLQNIKQGDGINASFFVPKPFVTITEREEMKNIQIVCCIKK